MREQQHSSEELRASLLRALPRLRAFAISLSGNVDTADDLVQDAIVKGLSHLDQFQLGTNLQAWLFTILRNEFYNSFRKRRREVEDPEGLMAASLSTAPAQHDHLDLWDLSVALTKLPVEHREVLLLVGAEGLSYEEAAEICQTRVGTIKSRMNRARARLAELLHVSNQSDLGRDPVIDAVVRADRTPLTLAA